ncbi:DEKNAAC105091 [Brettanomyces naardenensis]|uniref:DEKNAAC105091 n=1 Tax=Brettanomyces naardenensis TaxID=13370 RepID=A0A448YT40_BRENA|nr:DEKNAAC105091 [Brettanomyces naardenensis]
MKFAESLQEHMVPEWREQYMDYRDGKKRIKKLRKRTSVLEAAKSKVSWSDQSSRIRPSEASSRFHTPRFSFRSVAQPLSSSPGQLDVPSPRTQLPHNSSPLNGAAVLLPQPAITTPRSAYSATADQAATSATSATSGAAPSPSGRVTFSNIGSSSFSLPSPSINPRSPPPPPSIQESLSTDSGGEENSVDTDRSAPSNINVRTPLLSHDDRLTRATTRASLMVRRKSTMSKLFDTFRRNNSVSQPSDSSFVSATELDNMSFYAKQQFVAWVDSELRKVDNFYREREQASLERFLVLQDQMVQLNEEKQEASRQLERQQRMVEGPRVDATRSKRKPVKRSRRRHDSDASEDFEVQLDDDEDEDYEFNHSAGESSGDKDILGRDLAILGAARKHLQQMTFWAQRQLRVVNKFDWPSMPTFDWLRENGKREKQYYEEGYYDDEEDNEEALKRRNNDSDNASTSPNPIESRRDYVRRKPKPNKVPYFLARRQLKRAVYDFYRSLELLKSYRLLNRTAFRKLIKKYDKAVEDTLLQSYMKKVDSMYFTTSDVLDSLMVKVEEMFTQYFEHGNRKIAVTKLRAIQSEQTFYASDFFDGWFIGLAIPIFVFTVYFALFRTMSGALPEGKWLLQIWAGVFLLCLMAMLFGINCLVFNKYKVNYKMIFEFSPRDNLDFRQYLVLPTLLFFIGSLTAWFSFKDFFPISFNGRDWPWVFIIIALVILFCPFDIFYFSARTWFLSTLLRLSLSGLYPVEFRDFFIGDIFCSLTYSISNTSMFFCLYRTHWDKCLDGSGETSCGSSGSRLLGFLSALPNIWRFLQCFRRYADTGDGFPHLANMCKYFISCMYYMSLSMYRIDTIARYRWLLIFWGALNGMVSSAWDLLMDWSLFQFHSKNFLLRDELTYKRKWVYYVAMVIDVVLRHQWVCYALFEKHIQQSAITGFGVALAEVIRRFNWIFFRMENEHATNVHLFRASRDTPLPFPISRKRRSTHRAQTTTEEAVPSPSDEEARIGVTTGFVPAPQPAHTAEGLRARVQEPLEETIEEESVHAGRSYWSTLSKVLKTAHIKDFQRRKPHHEPSDVSTVAEEEDADESDNGGEDTDEDIAEDEYAH